MAFLRKHPSYSTSACASNAAAAGDFVHGFLEETPWSMLLFNTPDENLIKLCEKALRRGSKRNRDGTAISDHETLQTNVYQFFKKVSGMSSAVEANTDQNKKKKRAGSWPCIRTKIKGGKTYSLLVCKEDHHMRSQYDDAVSLGSRTDICFKVLDPDSSTEVPTGRVIGVIELKSDISSRGASKAENQLLAYLGNVVARQTRQALGWDVTDFLRLVMTGKLLVCACQSSSSVPYVGLHRDRS